ncbi:MAG: flagellar hook-associated protein FlgK [Firmicutes bacterium]|nr:flagellar hook-associated protein FlgK [Bacillota bacterium]
MRSTFAGLNTVVLGLAAQKLSLDTVGHNVANANTDGYSRQRVNLVTSNPQTIYTGAGKAQIGTGVLAQTIIRIRNTYVDQQMWKEASTLGYGQTMHDNLQKIEGVFMEPTETGMQTVFDGFWEAWNTLSTDANNNSARTEVRERGVELVDAIQQANTQLRNMISDINDVIKIRVDSINQISSEVLSLNKQIVSVEMGGQDNANDLRDRRDYLVDQLSEMINVRVTESADGSYTIQSGGTVLVDLNGVSKLETFSTKDDDYGYEVVNVRDSDGEMMSFTNGEMKGLIDSRDKTVETAGGDARESNVSAKAYLNQLSTMSQFLLQEFNDVHKSGYGNDSTDTTVNPGSTGINFFGEAGTDYEAVTGYSKLDWIKQLEVNGDLFQTGGLSKIAAKTLATITQSNVDGGKATLSLAGNTYTGGSVTQQYMVQIDSVNAATGAVTGLSYSLDGGTTYTAATAIAGGFLLNNGVQIAIKADTDNAQYNTYSFSMPPQGNAAGDNAVNLGNRLKVDTSDLLDKSSLDTFYGSMIGALGVQTENAERLTANQETLVNQITNWRESVAGVNLDEELSDMIRFQKGYSSAARVLTAMDEMLDKLINGTGVVGR